VNFGGLSSGDLFSAYGAADGMSCRVSTDPLRLPPGAFGSKQVEAEPKKGR